MVKKKSVKKKATRKKTIKNDGVNNKLIENFVSLQKVMTNMSIKFDNLANQISKLLDLFEISAKSLAKKEIKIVGDNNKESNEINKKIDNLLEQNKIIAKGMTIIHEKTHPIKEFAHTPKNRQIYPPEHSREKQEEYSEENLKGYYKENSQEDNREKNRKEEINKNRENLFSQNSKERRPIEEKRPQIKRGKDLFQRSILANFEEETPGEKNKDSSEKNNTERFKKLPRL